MHVSSFPAFFSKVMLCCLIGEEKREKTKGCRRKGSIYALLAMLVHCLLLRRVKKANDFWKGKATTSYFVAP